MKIRKAVIFVELSLPDLVIWNTFLAQKGTIERCTLESLKGLENLGINGFYFDALF